MENQGKKTRPKQTQNRPGEEKKMKPIPESDPIEYSEKGKLYGKVAFISGGDSGIGKAVGLLFAKEGANISFAYLTETEEARKTKKEIEAYGVKCLAMKADLSKENNCKKVIEKTIEKFEKLDILINNTGLHWEADSIEDIPTQQLEFIFRNNVFSYFWLTQYASPHLKKGASIINTASVTAYRGSDKMIDYAATKGAIVSFTKSLSANMVEKEIRVNTVAPGPIWTPLIASSFNKEKNAKFGSDRPMKRAGMPNEVAPCYLFLAGDDSSYMTGQVLHPNGGEIING